MLSLAHTPNPRPGANNFSSIYYSNCFFWLRGIAFTHHKIRKIAGMTDIEIPPRTTNRVRYSYKGYSKIESRPVCSGGVQQPVEAHFSNLN